MHDSENRMPDLTLDAAAAAKAEMPQLTLSLEPEAPAAPAVEEKKVEPVQIDESMLTEAERKYVDDFSQKIDISDSQMVLNYGVAAQKSVASFSESALGNVRNKDLGEIGDTLTSLTIQLKSLDQCSPG